MCKYRPRIYLAGPVAGLTWVQAMGWRRAAATELTLAGFEPAMPVEQERALDDGRVLSPMGEDKPGCSAAEIFGRDTDLLDSCEGVLADLRGATRPSLGTAWELGYAYACGKTIAIILGPEDIHQHAFIVGSGMVVDSTAAAIAHLKDVFDV